MHQGCGNASAQRCAPVPQLSPSVAFAYVFSAASAFISWRLNCTEEHGSCSVLVFLPEITLHDKNYACKPLCFSVSPSANLSDGRCRSAGRRVAGNAELCYVCGDVERAPLTGRTTDLTVWTSPNVFCNRGDGSVPLKLEKALRPALHTKLLRGLLHELSDPAAQEVSRSLWQRLGELAWFRHADRRQHAQHTGTGRTCFRAA